MNRVKKSALIAALLPLVAAPTAGAAVVLHLGPFLDVPEYLQGYPCQVEGSRCVAIESPNTSPWVANRPGYPDTYEDGVVAIQDAINAAIEDPDNDGIGSETDGKIVVLAYSSGARMATQWLVEHADDEDAPSNETLSFVLVGNPNRKYGGSDVIGSRVPATPQTQYDVIDVSIQYDLASDVPDNRFSPFYLLAIINAYSGFSGHLIYADVDITDPANAKWEEGPGCAPGSSGGCTTYILVPTENLPLLAPLRAIGLSALADSLNEPLKALIEQAYTRPVPFPTPTEPEPPAITTAATSAQSLSVVSDPTVTPQDATVTLRLAPTAPAVTESAPTSAEPEKANADVPTTSPSDSAGVLDTVKTITPPDDAIADKQSTTVSTTDGNKVEPGKVSGNQATTKSGKSGEQAASAKDDQTTSEEDS